MPDLVNICIELAFLYLFQDIGIIIFTHIVPLPMLSTSLGDVRLNIDADVNNSANRHEDTIN